MAAEYVPMVLHVTREQKEAFARWAKAEQRSQSAQARVVLERVVPPAFRRGGGRKQPAR